jgi:hypothetical protein
MVIGKLLWRVNDGDRVLLFNQRVLYPFNLSLKIIREVSHGTLSLTFIALLIIML